MIFFDKLELLKPILQFYGEESSFTKFLLAEKLEADTLIRLATIASQYNAFYRVVKVAKKHTSNIGLGIRTILIDRIIASKWNFDEKVSLNL